MSGYVIEEKFQYLLMKSPPSVPFGGPAKAILNRNKLTEFFYALI